MVWLISVKWWLNWNAINAWFYSEGICGKSRPLDFADFARDCLSCLLFDETTTARRNDRSNGNLKRDLHFAWEQSGIDASRARKITAPASLARPRAIFYIFIFDTATAIASARSSRLESLNFLERGSIVASFPHEI